MATTRIMALHGRNGQSVAQTIRDRLNYAQNPDKTQGGILVTAYECSPESAADEFAISKSLYDAITGRERESRKDVIAYMIRQSFAEGEVDPQTANDIGYALAMEFTKGEYQFVVATHTNTAHPHNHIIINSTHLDADRKFDYYHQCGQDIMKISDRLCLEHGLSVVENPKQKGKSYKEWDERRRGKSWKGRLQETIDRLLPESNDFEDFLARMRSEGYEVKLGKHTAFRASGQERFTRAKTLGAEYTEQALRERIGGGKVHFAEKKVSRPAGHKKVNLLVDIQAKMQAGKGDGYAQWARIFNLKEASKTLNFLTDNGISDYDELSAKADAAGEQFDALSVQIKQLEARISEVSTLRTHIINYSKTREVYVAYQKSRHKKEFRATHENGLALHESAKTAFEALGGAPIPKVTQLSAEYAALVFEKKQCYEDYKTARKMMIDLQTAKQNIDRILSIDNTQKSHRETER